MAKMDRCPICDVAVRPENLIRHLNDTHPRHPDTPGLVGKLKAEPGRTATRAPTRPIHLSRLQVAVVLVVIVIGLGTYYVLPYFSGATPLPCVSGNGYAYHWHTQLTIRIASTGSPVTIPADIGISATCMQVLHTHDTSGLIHIEPDTPEQNHVYTIGDFFRVWGKPFGNPTRMFLNSTQIPASSMIGLYNAPETIELEYATFTP